jgi:hypothetical protein
VEEVVDIELEAEVEAEVDEEVEDEEDEEVVILPARPIATPWPSNIIPVLSAQQLGSLSQQ